MARPFAKPPQRPPPFFGARVLPARAPGPGEHPLGSLGFLVQKPPIDRGHQGTVGDFCDFFDIVDVIVDFIPFNH